MVISAFLVLFVGNFNMMLPLNRQPLLPNSPKFLALTMLPKWLVTGVYPNPPQYFLRSYNPLTNHNSLTLLLGPGKAEILRGAQPKEPWMSDDQMWLGFPEKATWLIAGG